MRFRPNGGRGWPLSDPVPRVSHHLRPVTPWVPGPFLAFPVKRRPGCVAIPGHLGLRFPGTRAVQVNARPRPAGIQLVTIIYSDRIQYIVRKVKQNMTENTTEEMAEKYFTAIKSLLNAAIAEKNIIIPSPGFVRVRMNNGNSISNDIIRAALALADSTGGSVHVERVSRHTELVISHGVE